LEEEPNEVEEEGGGGRGAVERPDVDPACRRLEREDFLLGGAIVPGEEKEKGGGAEGGKRRMDGEEGKVDG